MPLKSAPFYWIVCDRAGCDARTPSLADGDEYAAWADDSQAEMYAEDSEWHVGAKTDSFAYLCPEHRLEHCERCSRFIGKMAGEQDYLCEDCAQRIKERPDVPPPIEQESRDDPAR